MSIVVNEELEQEDDLSEDSFADNFDEVSSPSEEDNADALEAEVTGELPDKFKGKSAEDIAKSYQELEKENGRRANEIGELRKLTDEFLLQQLKSPTEKETESSIDLDGFLDNPNEAVNSAIDKNPTIARLQEQMKQAVIKENRTGFESKHTDWNDVLQSGGFQKWIQDSPVRQNMFQEANASYNYDVLDEVFSLYRDIRGVAKEKAETTASTKRKKALNDTSVGRGSTGEVSKKSFRRADLIRLKQTNPQRYSDMNDEIMLAYAEGRVK